jgi:hypothetical protein
MDREAARRRLNALRNLTVDNGAFPAEVENARSLMRQLEQRYSIVDEGPEKERKPVPDWTYWNWMLGEFGLQGRRFLNSASANLDATRIVVVRLDSGEWQVQNKTQAGYQTVAKGHNPESLRGYLKNNAPRRYSMAG